MRWGDPWTREQALLADVVVSAWARNEKWPIFQFVAAELDTYGLEALDVLRSFPILGNYHPTTRWYSDVRFERIAPGPQDGSEVSLTVSGLSRHEHGVELAQAFVAVLRLASERHAQTPMDPSAVVNVTLASEELAEMRSVWWPPHALKAAGALLRDEWPAGVAGFSERPDGGWQITVDRRIRRYAGLTLEGYMSILQEDTKRSGPSSPYFGAAIESPTPSIVPLMQPDKAIAELQRLRTQADSDGVRRSGPSHDTWRAKVRVVMQRALGQESSILASFEDVRYHIGIYGGGPGEAERDRQYFADQVGVAAAFIDAAIFELELDLDPESSAATPSAAAADVAGTIFVVHGHDDGLKAEVSRLLERATSAEVVVLHEQPDRGRTVIEKFEAHAQLSMFAVVLLTPDDEGRAKGSDDFNTRARQNVILEHGYFLGRLGRSRVVALYKGDIELPSDLQGVIYKPADKQGAWKFELAKELRAAQIPVDMNEIV